MTEFNYQNVFEALTGGQEVLFKCKAQSYKAPYILAVFITAIVVLCLDMVFLGIGLVGAIFNDFKWVAVVLFIIKIFADAIIFAFCYALIVEKASKDKKTEFYVTEKQVFTIGKINGEIFFSAYTKKDCVFTIKKSLLNKFCGVCTLQITYKNKIKKLRFLTESDEETLSELL